VVQGLAKAGLAARGRVIVEKPFGRDQESARELNGWLAGAFEQRSIFRIDHYLGEESVEGLLVFRFANTFLEPFWNRNYVAGVQITLGEAFGTEGRAGFYDGVGAIRDVLQNHLLQVVALLAMEPPIADDADAYRDEEVKVLRQIAPLQPRNTVRGQYVGYLDEEGVAASSTTETFVSSCLTIESWRWAGGPFYLRAGKNMRAARPRRSSSCAGHPGCCSLARTPTCRAPTWCASASATATASLCRCRPRRRAPVR